MALVSGGLLGARTDATQSKAKLLTYHKAIARVLGGSERRQGKKHESKHGEASHDERERGAREGESTRTQTRGGRRTTSSSSGAAAELHTHKQRTEAARPLDRRVLRPGARSSLSFALALDLRRSPSPAARLLGHWMCVSLGAVSVGGRETRKRTSERDRAMQLCVALPTSTNDDSGTLCSTAQLALTAVRVACSCAQLLAHFALSVVCRSLPTGACTVFPAPYALRSR